MLSPKTSQSEKLWELPEHDTLQASAVQPITSQHWQKRLAKTLEVIQHYSLHTNTRILSQKFSR